MTDVLFYHLRNMNADNVLPPLLEKSIERGWRVVVQSTTEQRVAQLDSHLWVYRADSFLPHAAGTDANAAEQPIVLTVDADNPNSAKVRFLVDSAPVPDDAASYDRVVLVFDGDNDDALASARRDWARCKTMNLERTYWQADESGRWQRKA